MEKDQVEFCRHTFDVDLHVERVVSLPYASGKFFFLMVEIIFIHVISKNSFDKSLRYFFLFF